VAQHRRTTSDADLLPLREIDDALGLTELAGAVLSDGRRGNNTRRFLTGVLRRYVFRRRGRRMYVCEA
jgi:hypothetical protein